MQNSFAGNWFSLKSYYRLRMLVNSSFHLTLIRHAKSSWEQPGLDDHERPLNNRGEKAAHAMGQFFKNINYQWGEIWTSTAVRAVSTAAIITEHSQVPAGNLYRLPELYTFSAESLLNTIRQLQVNHHTLLLSATIQP